LRVRIEEIKTFVDSLKIAGDSISKNISSLLDELMISIEPSNQKLWNESQHELIVAVERLLLDEQTVILELIGSSQKIIASSARTGVFILIVMLLLSAAVAVFIARIISKPIAHLRQATHYARLGKYDIRVPFETHDEIADLTADFNAMMKALGKLEKMKSMFLASITHDLKSPLYRVKLGIENLEDEIHGPLSDEQKKALSQLLGDVDTLSRLIYDILDLQKMESGKFELELEDVELDPFVRETVKKHTISFADKGVGLALRMNLDDVVANIDRKQIERVFENLLSNALKFTPKSGKVTVIANHREHLLHFAISDTGPGISEDEGKKIFDKFYRASTGKNVRGTGLGLTVAKLIIESHKGRIWVESKIGEGTSLNFVIPLKTAPKKRKQGKDF